MAFDWEGRVKERDVWYEGAWLLKFIWPKYEAEWQLAGPC